MTSALKSEIKKLIEFVKTHHLVHKLEKEFEEILHFLENHSEAVIKIAKATIQAVKGDSATPLESAIGQVAKFPPNPNTENVIKWIADDLIPALNAMLTQLSKEEPDEKKYIDIIEGVLKGIQKILDFIKEFMHA